MQEENHMSEGFIRELEWFLLLGQCGEAGYGRDDRVGGQDGEWVGQVELSDQAWIQRREKGMKVVYKADKGALVSAG
ncbi:hypothetical protein E2C01_066764 [Portunus trituberculatus]|uniref:Uncharacterized protein n=1 Tax=Portunus trituberculatus TaxID=210409 RepID=A0A5B7HUQ6_PORTR|nr:hypothetical protein [Portunus trituberculatus]